MLSQSPAEERHTLRTHLRAAPVIRVDLGGAPLILESAWGLFSAKAIDEGTALLINELLVLPPQGRALDMGCGYGAIGLVLARLWPDSAVVLADQNLLAVETTQANISRNSLSNATAVLTPGFRDVPPGPYDLITSNLPAQAGNEAIDALLLDAYEQLAPDGSLAVVTVVGMRRYIKRRLLAIYGNYHKAKQGARHVVSEAARSPKGA